MYAIIEDGSHQFRVREGDRIRVDRRDGKAGDELVFSKVLLITGEDGNPTIGAPAVDGAQVVGKIVNQFKSEEDHHPEVPPAQKRASAERSSPALHDGPDHQRRSAQ